MRFFDVPMAVAPFTTDAVPEDAIYLVRGVLKRPHTIRKPHFAYVAAGDNPSADSPPFGERLTVALVARPKEHLR